MKNTNSRKRTKKGEEKKASCSSDLHGRKKKKLLPFYLLLTAVTLLVVSLILLYSNRDITSPEAVINTDPIEPESAAASTKGMEHQLLSVIQSDQATDENIRFIHRLSKTLNERQIDIIQEYLKQTQGNIVIKNDLLNALRRQESFKETARTLTEFLMGLYEDRQQQIVMRNYALQHLISWMHEIGEIETLEHTLWNALNEAEGGIAGTALLGLNRLTQRGEHIDLDRLRSTALILAEKKQKPFRVEETIEQTLPNNDLTRITALAICAQLGEKKILSIATQLAENSQDIPLRAAAISALGQLGSWMEEATLVNLLTNKQDPLTDTIQFALKKLRSRSSKVLYKKGCRYYLLENPTAAGSPAATYLPWSA